MNKKNAVGGLALAGIASRESNEPAAYGEGTQSTGEGSYRPLAALAVWKWAIPSRVDGSGDPQQGNKSPREQRLRAEEQPAGAVSGSPGLK